MTTSTSSNAVAAIRDAKNSAESTAFIAESYWLANPRMKRHYNHRITGGKGPDWLGYAFEKYARPLATEGIRVLSIGCGFGDFERHLFSLCPAARCDAFDVSPNSVSVATQRAAEAGISPELLNYFVADANSIRLPHECYDLAVFNSSLHHVGNLEHLLGEVVKSLATRGLVFVHEYVGPNRFAFEQRQREIMDSMLQLIPRRLRIFASGDEKLTAGYPDPAAVVADDPSEAIRSEEIPSMINRYFNVLETQRAPGTVLQFLLSDIAGNFREDDPEASSVLEMLILIESTLMDVHELHSDFLLIIAQKRDLAHAIDPRASGEAVAE